MDLELRCVPGARQARSEVAAELHCVCRKPEDPDNPQDFVQCEACEAWFHPECVGTTMQVQHGRS